ncbi:hypothetical protein SGLAM104S_06461 [Streptomyces glaucescens]
MYTSWPFRSSTHPPVLPKASVPEYRNCLFLRRPAGASEGTDWRPKDAVVLPSSTHA